MERTWTWPMINSIQNNVICLTYGWFTPFWSKSEIIVSITPRRKDRLLYKVFHRCKDWRRWFCSPQSAWESKELNYNAQWLQMRSPDTWGSSRCHRKQKEGRWAIKQASRRRRWHIKRENFAKVQSCLDPARFLQGSFLLDALVHPTCRGHCCTSGKAAGPLAGGPPLTDVSPSCQHFITASRGSGVVGLLGASCSWPSDPWLSQLNVHSPKPQPRTSKVWALSPCLLVILSPVRSVGWSGGRHVDQLPPPTTLRVHSASISQSQSRWTASEVDGPLTCFRKNGFVNCIFPRPVGELVLFASKVPWLFIYFYFFFQLALNHNIQLLVFILVLKFPPWMFYCDSICLLWACTAAYCSRHSQRQRNKAFLQPCLPPLSTLGI